MPPNTLPKQIEHSTLFSIGLEGYTEVAFFRLKVYHIVWSFLTDNANSPWQTAYLTSRTGLGADKTKLLHFSPMLCSQTADRRMPGQIKSERVVMVVVVAVFVVLGGVFSI